MTPDEKTNERSSFAGHFDERHYAPNRQTEAD